MRLALDLGLYRQVGVIAGHPGGRISRFRYLLCGFFGQC